MSWIDRVRESRSREGLWGWLRFLILGEYSVVLMFALVFVVFAFAPDFLTMRNFTNLIRRTALTGIVALGATLVILVAEIDLSVGSVAALTGMLAAGLNVRHSLGAIPSFLLPLGVALVIGVAMGLIVTKFKVHSFVVTLGVLSIGRGATLIYSGGEPIYGVTDSFKVLGAGKLWSIPVPTLLYVALILVFWLLTTQTVFGRYIYAIGGNKQATEYLGIPVERVKISVFAIGSLMAGLSGMIIASRLYSGQTRAGVGMELDVIAAVVIGGTSLFGGRGGIIQTVAGSLILATLANGLNLWGVGSWYQQVISGFIIIIAVCLDRFRVSLTE